MNRFSVFVLLLLVVSCKEPERRPADVLPPERMIVVLRQLMTADEWVSLQAEQNPALPVLDSSIALYNTVLRAEELSQEQFRRSFRWYQTQPAQMQALLDSLQKRPNGDTSLPASADVLRPGKGGAR